MKRVLSFLLAIIILFVSIPAMAADTRKSGLYTYEIKGNGTITITDFDWDNNDGDIYIPNMIDGYTLTGIGDEAFACEKDRHSQVSVTLSENIKTIGNMAFAHSNISAINIPTSLQYIGAAAFFGCPSCQFKVAANHNYFAVIDFGLYNKTKKELIAYSWENEEKKGFVKIEIPEGILSIGAYALAGIDRDGVSGSKPNISLPSTIESISDYAFGYSRWLDSLSGTLTNLHTIGTGAFRGCWVHNTSLTMPSVKVIGDDAFLGVDFHPIYPNGVYSIDFQNAPLTQIGNRAFSEVNLPPAYGTKENVFAIPVQNCSNIGKDNSGLGILMSEEVNFSPDLTTIPAGLNPQVNTLPTTVLAIEAGAFTEKVSDFRLSYSLNDIAVDAFPKGSTFIVDAGSYAELWCSENGFGYSIEGQQDDLSWLTN